MKQRQVTILGAGPAGLSSAHHLISRGTLPMVLEQAPAVGGFPVPCNTEDTALVNDFFRNFLNPIPRKSGEDPAGKSVPTDRIFL